MATRLVAAGDWKPNIGDVFCGQPEGKGRATCQQYGRQHHLAHPDGRRRRPECPWRFGPINLSREQVACAPNSHLFVTQNRNGRDLMLIMSSDTAYGTAVQKGLTLPTAISSREDDMFPSCNAFHLCTQRKASITFWGG